jgi:AcrR family transcriptional regulator
MLNWSLIAYRVPAMESASTPTTGPAKPRARRGRPPELGLAERRRHQLVESACAVFAEHGYETASMSDVAKHAGVGQGTVYRYFPSKRELLDHVLDHGVERMLDAVTGGEATQAESLEDLSGQVSGIAERLFTLIEAEPNLLKLVLVEASAIDDELKARLLGLENTLSAMMASYLDKGVRAGWLRADLDTEMVAHGMNSMVVPGFLLALRGDATAERRARYVTTLTSFVMFGLRGPETA